jgi:hypothetical protein
MLEPGLPTSTVAKARTQEALPGTLRVLATVEVVKPPRSHIHVIEIRFDHRLSRVATWRSGQGRAPGKAELRLVSTGG